jgi:hypothetical protein
MALGWYASRDDAAEAASRWEKAFILLLKAELNERVALGQFCCYAFNESDDSVIQGRAFISHSDDDRLRQEKLMLCQHVALIEAIRKVSPATFEKVCAGILLELGLQGKVTQYVGDEGIDFYGQLSLEKYLGGATRFPNVERQLTVWVVGQAKQYAKNRVSTPNIRELVGAASLARARVFAGKQEKYPELQIRVCDPFFCFFITTGELSRDSWRLLKRSGVIGMDGPMVASLLARAGVGFCDGLFDGALFRDWVARIPASAIEVTRDLELSDNLSTTV